MDAISRINFFKSLFKATQVAKESDIIEMTNPANDDSSWKEVKTSEQVQKESEEIFRESNSRKLNII